MANPSLYKKKPVVDIRNRNTVNLTNEENSEITNTVSKFFQLFKAKHL